MTPKRLLSPLLPALPPPLCLTSLVAGMAILCLLTTCKNAGYQQTHHFAEDHWHTDSTLRYELNMPAASYDIGLCMRYRGLYPYYNLYLACSLRRQSDQQLLWSALREFKLFDEKNGKPTGSGSGDVFLYRETLLPNYALLEDESYTLSVRQYMRLDSLKGMVSLGIELRNPVRE